MNIRKLTALGALALAVAFGSSARAGIKYWDNQDYKAYDAGDYAPGAVWNFDGIDNAGVGVHDSTAPTWKNLGSSGANNDVWVRYLNEGGNGWANSVAPASLASVHGRNLGSWTENGFTLTGDSEWRAAGSAAGIESGTNYTLQALVSGDWSAQKYAKPYVMSVQQADFCFYGDPANSRLYWGMSSTTANHVFFSADSLGYMTAIANADENTVAFFSGTTIPTSGDGFRHFSVSAKKDSGYCIGGYTGINGQFVGTIHSYRYYKRVLTEEELAWNRVVDERRFFDRAAPLPVTNVVVATAVAGVEGTEPAGNYAVDGRHLFTAPATVTAGGVDYVCTGYTLEARNGDGWSAPVFRKAALFQPVAFLATDADCVRLTWQWAKADGLANLYTVDDYVWTGLEVFYDGICNVGTNQPHSYSTVNWVNLGSKGDVNDVFVQRLNAAGSAWADATDLDPVGERDPGHWTENGFRMDAEGRFRCNSPGNFAVGTDYSLQMLIDANASDQIADSSFPFGANNTTFGIQIRKTDNLLAWRCLGLSSGYPNLPGDHYDYVTAIMHSDNKQAFFSGTTEPTSGTGYKTGTSAGYSDTGFCLGGYGKSGVTDRFVGTLKSFRQYDHALGPAEVAQNRKVDNWRYFGLADVTNVIVQSTVPYLRGDEPDGAYAVDGSHVFTAPATMTAKGIDYACDGYTVETWGPLANKGDGWSAATHFTGNSYAYTTAAGKVRLTWKWKATRGLRTAADYGFDDYSQAGIVWNFDGLLNQGVGVARSTTATTWKNLAPDPVTPELFVQRINSGRNNYDNTSPLSSLAPSGDRDPGEWTEDGFRLKGDSRWRGLGQVGPVANWTLQTLVDADVDDIVNDTMYVINVSWPNFAMVLRKSKDAPVPNCFYFNAQDAQAASSPRPYFQNESGTYGFATAILDSSDRTAKMFQGVTPPTGGTIADGYHQYASAVTPFKDTNFGLGASAGYTEYFIGTLKSIRYYDRVLTEEELVRNRNADAARYFGELGVTNLVVEVAEGEDFACDPAPGAYFVEGSWTFSAARASGGPMPAGCRVQDWDPVNERWTNSRGVNELSYTYDASCGVKQRIVWRSLRPFILMVR